MARHALVAAAFSALTLLALALCDRAVDLAVDRPVERRYADLVTSAERLEAIVIGSSHSEFGIDVAALEAPGLRPYNFANAHSGPLYFADWYALYRGLRGGARLALVGVDWSWTHLPAELDADADSLPLTAWLARLRAHPDRTAGLLRERWALPKEQPGLLQQLFAEPYRFEAELRRYHRGGTPLAVKPYLDAPGGARREEREPDRPGAWAAFERLCQALAADGARVVFVQVPEYLPVAGSHPRENAAIAALARRHGWPFLNYNAERAAPLNQQQALFADWGHLNAIGRARFSRQLRRDLEALGVLSPARAGG